MCFVSYPFTFQTLLFFLSNHGWWWGIRNKFHIRDFAKKHCCKYSTLNWRQNSKWFQVSPLRANKKKGKLQPISHNGLPKLHEKPFSSLIENLLVVTIILRIETSSKILFALVLLLLNQNILLSSHGVEAVLKIADFGLSR